MQSSLSQDWQTNQSTKSKSSINNNHFIFMNLSPPIHRTHRPSLVTWSNHNENTTLKLLIETREYFKWMDGHADSSIYIYIYIYISRERERERRRACRREVRINNSPVVNHNAINYCAFWRVVQRTVALTRRTRCSLKNGDRLDVEATPSGAHRQCDVQRRATGSVGAWERE